MALNLQFINTVLPLMDMVDRRTEILSQKKTLGSIGYPDIITENRFLDTQPPTVKNLFTPCAANAARWHGLSSTTHSSCDIRRICDGRQWNFQYFDIQPGTGPSDQTFNRLDLNQDLPHDLYLSCDVLVDSGTAEHCFNIGKVFENYFYLLRPGGILIQYIPFFSPNHGFWSANPTVIFDIASCNPIKILKCELQLYAGYSSYFASEYTLLEHNKTSRFSTRDLKKDDIVLIYFIYKKLGKALFQFPVQAKYRAVT
jgi:hypothetical protein